MILIEWLTFVTVWTLLSLPLGKSQRAYVSAAQKYSRRDSSSRKWLAQGMRLSSPSL